MAKSRKHNTLNKLNAKEINKRRKMGVVAGGGNNFRYGMLEVYIKI